MENFLFLYRLQQVPARNCSASTDVLSKLDEPDRYVPITLGI